MSVCVILWIYCVQTYSNCGCIGSSGGGAGGEGIGEGGSARPGLCLPRCNLLKPFAVIMFLMSLLGSVARVPSTIVGLRYSVVFLMSIYRSNLPIPTVHSQVISMNGSIQHGVVIQEEF